MEPQPVEIRGDTILLQALLKLVGAISNGGEVKSFLAANAVWVNGQRESRRGRQLHDGDIVILPDRSKVRIVAEKT